MEKTRFYFIGFLLSFFLLFLLSSLAKKNKKMIENNCLTFEMLLVDKIITWYLIHHQNFPQDLQIRIDFFNQKNFFFTYRVLLHHQLQHQLDHLLLPIVVDHPVRQIYVDLLHLINYHQVPYPFVT